MSFWSALKWSIDIHLFLQAQTPPQMKLLEGIQLVNRCRELLQAKTIGQGECNDAFPSPLLNPLEGPTM
jgi:hypothetical protein